MTNTAYNYRNEMYDDIIRAITEDYNIADYIEDGEINTDRMYEDLNDSLFVDDGVTGNSCGSYFFNAYEAQQAISGNLDILVEALEEFGDDPKSYKQALKSPEYADVTIRCYLLGEVLTSIIEDIKQAYEQSGNELDKINYTELVTMYKAG